MSEVSGKQNNQILTPSLSVNIDQHMRAKKNASLERLNMKNAIKLQPFTWLVVSDPLMMTRAFAMVNFDGATFVYFETSESRILTEKNMDIPPKILADFYDIKVFTPQELGKIINDDVIGNVYITLTKKIKELTKKNYNFELESTLTALNGMLILHLIPQENIENMSFEQCRQLAMGYTDHEIEQAAWLALRKREAKFIVEREMLAKVR